MGVEGDGGEGRWGQGEMGVRGDEDEVRVRGGRVRGSG